MKLESLALIHYLNTLDPFSPPSWSLSFRPHTNTLTCPSWVGSVEVGFLLSARLCLAASSSSSNARKEKLAAMSSSSAFARAVRLIPWILQSMPLLLHCRMPISKKRYSWNNTRVYLGLETTETKTNILMFWKKERILSKTKCEKSRGWRRDWNNVRSNLAS